MLCYVMYVNYNKVIYGYTRVSNVCTNMAKCCVDANAKTVCVCCCQKFCVKIDFLLRQFLTSDADSLKFQEAVVDSCSFLVIWGTVIMGNRLYREEEKQ